MALHTPSQPASPAPALHLFCGKAGAGKSTLAQELARDHGMMLISEDGWLSTLFPAEIASLADYAERATRLKRALAPHLTQLLQHGVMLALDFPMNTAASRAWARDLAEAAGVSAVLHWLDLPDDVCLARVNARNASGEHPYTLSAEQFAQLGRHFEVPHPEEGLTLQPVRHF